jgi:hypothetical protein
MVRPIEYAEANPEVRAVFDDIKATRGVEDVNNFWKYLAHDPRTLRRTWESVKEVMAGPSHLDLGRQRTGCCFIPLHLSRDEARVKFAS